ncbi:MAG: hypothetical protein AAF682_11480 [Planctomycetota bacterium]
MTNRTQSLRIAAGVGFGLVVLLVAALWSELSVVGEGQPGGGMVQVATWGRFTYLTVETVLAPGGEALSRRFDLHPAPLATTLVCTLAGIALAVRLARRIERVEPAAA